MTRRSAYATLALSLVACASLVPAALASEASGATEAAQGGLPMAYVVQWMLLLGLLSVTVLFMLSSVSWTPHQLHAGATGRVILAFSSLQVLLAFAVLVSTFFAESYHEPVFAGYLRHLTLLLTGGLVTTSAFLKRKKR